MVVYRKNRYINREYNLMGRGHKRRLGRFLPALAYFRITFLSTQHDLPLVLRDSLARVLVAPLRLR